MIPERRKVNELTLGIASANTWRQIADYNSGRAQHRVPRGLPEVRKQTWESREAKTGDVDKTEYERIKLHRKKALGLKGVPLGLKPSTSVCLGGSY